MIKTMKIIVVVLVLLITTATQAQEVVTRQTEDGWEELSYDNNKKLHGRCLAWNSDSVLIAEANYLHGTKHGIWKIWWDNGQLAYKMYYSMGRKVGKWQQWNRDAVLLNEKIYR